MPFTPFHLGPATTIKAIIPNYFSFIVFCFTQFIIDLESLYFLIQGEHYVHRFLHTYIGATTVLIATLLIGKPVGELFISIWNSILSPKQTHWFYIDPSISNISLFFGATFGVYSHVFLDSIMHSDIKPLAPFFDENSLYAAISLNQLHLSCLFMGGFGLAIMLFIFIWNKFTFEI
ncbi:MAG: DUF4184 domain-containing protein [Methylococcales bacterium]|jgi:hypothetical protein|nr:DUF4184 domain-containing protein [Methylococcales bacterium]